MTTQTYDPTQPLPPDNPHIGWSDPPGELSARRHFREWLAHVDAGRIGGNPPCPQDVAARRERNEEILRRFTKR